MAVSVAIEGGFAKVEAGLWLMGRSQPAAFSGSAVRRRRRGWCVRDRSRLDLVETTSLSHCADAAAPFLTHIPCAANVFAVSDKVLVAPASARIDAHVIKAIPMSARGSLCSTEFGIGESDDSGSAWVVMATRSRTARVPLSEGETLSVRPDAVVAWTGGKPTGFCPRVGLLDILLPRAPRDLLFTFYGPGVVWIEGSGKASMPDSRLSMQRRFYGV